MDPDPALTALRMLADVVSDGVMLFDEHDRLVYVSGAAAALVGAAPGALLGLSTHNVGLGTLKAAPGALARLRAGDELILAGPEGESEAIGARLISLPVTPGRGQDAGFGAQEPPTALVLRDRRPRLRLRRLEDMASAERIAARRGALEDGPLRLRSAEALRQRALVEVARAWEARESLSAVVVGLAAEQGAALAGDWLLGTLRGDDLAGRLDHDPLGELQGPASSLALAAVLLPGTALTGAHAVALRLSSLARDAGIDRPVLGVATLRDPSGHPGVSNDDAAAAAADDLLRRATLDALADLEIDDGRRVAA